MLCSVCPVQTRHNRKSGVVSGLFVFFMTVENLYEGFIKDCRCRKLAPSTIAKHSVLFIKVIIPALGHKPVAELLPIDANDIIAHANGFGKCTARLAVLTFRRILHYVKKSRIASGVQADEIEVPTYKRTKDVMAWSREEIRELRVVLSKDHSASFSKHCRGHLTRAHQHAVKRTSALFELMIHSGLRLSEALSANKEDINWERSELRIEDAKDEGVWKTVFLHGAEQSIKQYLEIRKDNSNALFVSVNGTRLRTNSAGTTLKRLKKRSQLETKQSVALMHKTCRSTFITIPLQEGIDPKIVQKLAHHKSLHTTLDHYRKITPQEVKLAHLATLATV